ncbi:FAD-dependent oxidoreductase [Pantoea tagorei]
MIYDLIVVGSGSVGAAAGFYATQAGLSVLMIDSSHPPHTQGAHHGETRLIRHAYGEGERYVPLVLRAQKLWDELEELSGERIMHRSGIINLAPIHSAFIRNVIDSAQAWKLDVQLLQADEVRQRWPQIGVPDGYIGVF